MKHYDRVKFRTDTLGGGAIAVGVPATGMRTPQAAGVQNGDVVSYVLEDGAAWEIGRGVFNNGSIERGMLESTTGATLSLSGSALCFLTLLSADLSEVVDEDRSRAIAVEEVVREIFNPLTNINSNLNTGL